MEEDGLIRIRYVQPVKDRFGRVHLYFRKADHREGPLVNAAGTQALKDEVQAIVDRLAASEAAAKRPRAGTVGGMLRAYAGSIVDGHRTGACADFLVLARSTQQAYQDYVDEMIEDIGDVALGDVTRSWIIQLRDAWAVRGYRAANQRMQVLKNALSPAIDDETDDRITGDPFHKVKKVRRPHAAGEAHPIWDDEEVEVAIADAIASGHPGLARAIALGRWGGFRRGTICAIPLGARTIGFDEKGQPHPRLYWITEKRKVLCDKREDPRLTALMLRTPNRALTLAYNADERAWKERQLSQAVQRLLDRLAKAGKVRSAVDVDGHTYCPLTIHGLRHSRGVELAQAGASDSQIMAQLEHSTDRAAKNYRRQAERRQLADSGQDQVDKVVNLRARAKAKQQNTA